MHTGSGTVYHGKVDQINGFYYGQGNYGSVMVNSISSVGDIINADGLEIMRENATKEMIKIISNAIN